MPIFSNTFAGGQTRAHTYCANAPAVNPFAKKGCLLLQTVCARFLEYMKQHDASGNDYNIYISGLEKF